MLKMIKKLVLTAAAIGGGLYVANECCGNGSVETWFKRTRARVEKKISPEFELARIRDQIAELTPDMHRNISKIAEEMVEVKALESRVGDLQGKLASYKNDLKVLTEAAENNTKLVTNTGREFKVTPMLVKDKVRACKNVERELLTSQKILEAKQTGLDAAREQLSVMKQQREELKVMAENFEAELKTLKLEQTRAKIKLDDSRLAEIKQSFEKLRGRIEVERKKAELAGQFHGGETFTTPDRKIETAQEAFDEARDYLNGPKEKTEAAKK